MNEPRAVTTIYVQGAGGRERERESLFPRVQAFVCVRGREF